MKPLPIKDQIRILRRSLWIFFISSMCIKIVIAACNLGYGIRSWHRATDIIPTFNHSAYIRFYPNIKTVQERQHAVCWDSNTLFGNLRRRLFIRHLIKELKKQL